MLESQALSQEFLDNVKLNTAEMTESQNVDMGQETQEIIPKEENLDAALSLDKPSDDSESNEEQILNAEKMENHQESTSEDIEKNQLLAAKIGDLEKTVLSLNDAVQKIAGSSEATAKQLNQVNENLHRENQKLKEGLYDSLTMPILKDLIALESDIQMNIERYRKKGGEETAGELESIVEDISMVLEKYNVEVYRPQEGDPYEPIVQKIVKTIDTNEKQKDRTIAEVRSFGYRFIKGETSVILAPCKVYVYKLNKELV